MTRFKQKEAVQMVAAVLAGSQMGPGDGWFHPGQSRYGDTAMARADTIRMGMTQSLPTKSSPIDRIIPTRPRQQQRVEG